jgi:3-deoxy-D-manno-octulosonic acid kinase
LAQIFRDMPGPSGRAPTAVLRIPELGERILLRELRPGGFLGKLQRRRNPGPRRALEELEVTARLREVGAPVPEPALLWSEARAGRGRLVLGTVFVEDSADALAWLTHCNSVTDLRAGLTALAAGVRAFHDAGGSHPDLQIKNLLISHGADGERIGTLIDLSGAPPPANVPPARRMRELMRLYRSAAKRDVLTRVGQLGLSIFLSAYTAGDRSLRRALLTALPTELARVKRHALLYPRGRASLVAPRRPVLSGRARN